MGFHGSASSAKSYNVSFFAKGIPALASKAKKAPHNFILLFNMSSTTITTTPRKSWKRKPTAKDRSMGIKRQRVIVVAPRRSLASVRSVLPVSKVAILKYNQFVAAPGTTIDHVWNLNSLYDPDRTGTGHQPYGFDTMATMYNRYRVLRVRYLIHFLNFTASNAVYKATILANNDGSAITGAETLVAETPGSQTKPNMATYPCNFSGVFDLANITGVSSAAYKDDRFQSLMSTSPTELICLHVVQSAYSGTAVAAGVTGFDLTLWFEAEFYDRLGMGQS